MHSRCNFRFLNNIETKQHYELRGIVVVTLPGEGDERYEEKRLRGRAEDQPSLTEPRQQACIIAECRS